MSEQVQRRCLWCCNRIGEPRYFINDDWWTLPSAVHYFGQDVSYTDGLCPECLIAETEKIEKLKQKENV